MILKGFLRTALLSLFVCSGALAYAKAPVPTAAALPAPSASFDSERIVSLFTQPTIEGSARNIVAPLDFSIASPNSFTYIYKRIPIHDGRFSVTVGTPLPTGLYTAQLTSASTTLGQALVRIGFKALPRTERVDLPPYDVVDGKLLRFLIRADGDGPISIQSFTFTIATTAADVSDAQLSAYSDPTYTTQVGDGPLNTELAELDGNTLRITPDNPLSIPQGRAYYFELTASVGPEDSDYDVNTKLSDYLWSPNSFSATSTDQQDWYSAATTTLRNSIFTGRAGTPPSIPPSCSMSATASTTTTQPVSVSWSSEHADYALWSDGSREVVEGSKTYSNMLTPKLLQLNFYGKYGTATCFVQFSSPSSGGSQSSQGTSNSGGATTTAATTTTPVIVDSLLASSTTGVVPFTARFLATVNTAKSCAAITYTLGYGDLSTSTISVSKNTCRPVATTFTHTYQKTGTFTAALYISTGTSSTQLIQKQTITVKAKTAWFRDIWAGVAGVWASFMR